MDESELERERVAWLKYTEYWKNMSAEEREAEREAERKEVMEIIDRLAVKPSSFVAKPRLASL